MKRQIKVDDKTDSNLRCLLKTFGCRSAMASSSRLGGKSLDTILAKMLFQTIVYHIWRERNARRHQQSWKSTDQLSRLIDKAVRNRISSLRYKPQHKLERLL
ncbi:hypothetical protein Bca4012_053128 [Brassica carinata]